MFDYHSSSPSPLSKWISFRYSLNFLLFPFLVVVRSEEGTLIGNVRRSNGKKTDGEPVSLELVVNQHMDTVINLDSGCRINQDPGKGSLSSP